MTASVEDAADGPQGSDLESKIFQIRGDKKLVRHLAFAKAAGKRPNTLRVVIGSTHGTSLTLKNSSFARQYRRAIDKIADSYAVPEGDPLRAEMEKTAGDFLAYYNLRTQPFRFAHQGEFVELDDVAFPSDAGIAETVAKSAPTRKAPTAMQTNGLVRGVTFRSARSGQPALIQVNLWRGKGLRLSLENASFAMQYTKAVEAVADSLGMAPEDPMRAQLRETGQAFLKHYRLSTAAVTIPDVVVQNPNQQS